MDFFGSLNHLNLLTEAAYLTLIYLGVIIAMLMDLITGVNKAIKKGEATTSRGFRRTTEKAALYFMPMICLTAIDIIASEFLDYPYFTGVLGVFNIYIEIRSIWENTHSKEETKKDLQCAEDLIKFIADNKDTLKDLLSK